MSVEEIVSTILHKRGISKKDVTAFLNPDFNRDLHAAASMKGMRVTVDRILQAIQAQEKVIVFGDYDADGVPATALLVRTFRKLGLEVIPLIPSRTQGYGLTESVVEEVKRQMPNLLITVDNGTVAKQEIAELKEAGIEVIVIDHHVPQAEHIAEDAFAIINPKQADCPYPFKEMCACALAWKVMGEVYKKKGEDLSALKWELDLVALSTIADMVPLVGENRSLVQFGLKIFPRTKNVGLRALVESAGLSPLSLSAGDIGYKIAPRINAPSRMHEEEKEGKNVAVSLLTTADPVEANTLAHFLSARNSERQGLVGDHIEEAEIQAKEQKQNLVMVLFQENWSTGVIGLVASRIMEKYKRPAVVLALEGEEVKGSVRSVEGVHAVEMLESAESYLERYGGHAKAAGLTLRPESLSHFRNAVNSYVQHLSLTLEELRENAEKKPDLSLELDQVTVKLCAALQSLEPFGIGFPRPLFVSECQIATSRKVGSKGQHLSGFLAQGNLQKKFIAFNLGYKEINPERWYQVCYTLESETWQGVESAVCHVCAFNEIL